MITKAESHQTCPKEYTPLDCNDCTFYEMKFSYHNVFVLAQAKLFIGLPAASI